MRAARRRPKSARFVEKRRRRSTNGNESDVMRIIFWTCVLVLSAGFGIFSQLGERKPSGAKFKSNISPSKAKGIRYQEEKVAVSHKANVHHSLQHGMDGMDGLKEGEITAMPPQPIRNGYAEEQFEPKPWKPGIASKLEGRDGMGRGGKGDGMGGYAEGNEPAGPPQPIRNGGDEEKFEPKPWKPGIASKLEGRDSNSEDGVFGIGGNRGRGDEPVDSGKPGSESDGAFDYRDPADAVELSYSAGSSEAGPMEKFLSEGKKLPVVLLTCNRATLLKQTIESLHQVRGMDMDKVMVLQDGSDTQVAAVVKAERLYLKQNTAVSSLRGGPNAGNGAARIAMHYKFSLDHVFERDPEAPGVIIVEDDLLFSPDFLEYFEANAPVLERDSNTLVLSAWNDNGYRGRVSNKSELKRTTYFPGLGWLLSRQLYEELRPRWPREHWDHWLRNPNQHRGRECVFPEVPRTYHNGIKGTFMNQEMHDNLFKNIDFNTDASFKWPSPTVRAVGVPPPYAQALRDNYERRMEARIRAARHINDLNDLPQNSSNGKKKTGGGEIVFWYSLGRSPRGKEPPFSALSKVFGIWHEYERTEHNGMHSFRYDGDSHVMLINTAQSSYVNLKPMGLIPAAMDHLRGLGSAGGGHQDGRRALQTVPADKPNMSCDVVCADKFPGQCLVSSNPSHSTCSAKHELTRRICPCVSSG